MALADEKDLSTFLEPLGYAIFLLGKDHGASRLHLAGVKLAPTGKPVDLTYVEHDVLKQRPFCLLAMSHFPHPPFTPPVDPDPLESQPFWMPPGFRAVPDASNRFHGATGHGYRRAAEAGDRELASLLALLDTHRLAASTLVVYASDHGAAGKWSCYDEPISRDIS